MSDRATLIAHYRQVHDANQRLLAVMNVQRHDAIDVAALQQALDDGADLHAAYWTRHSGQRAENESHVWERAIEYGDEPVWEALLNAELPSAPSEPHLLSQAVRGRQPDLVHLLLARGWDPNGPTKLSPWDPPPVVTALELGQDHQLAQLLRAGADLRTLDALLGQRLPPYANDPMAQWGTQCSSLLHQARTPESIKQLRRAGLSFQNDPQLPSLYAHFLSNEPGIISLPYGRRAMLETLAEEGLPWPQDPEERLALLQQAIALEHEGAEVLSWVREREPDLGEVVPPHPAAALRIIQAGYPVDFKDAWTQERWMGHLGLHWLEIFSVRDNITPVPYAREWAALFEYGLDLDTPCVEDEQHRRMSLWDAALSNLRWRTVPILSTLLSWGVTIEDGDRELLQYDGLPEVREWADQDTDWAKHAAAHLARTLALQPRCTTTRPRL